ncbi:MAG: hypothetical protein KDA21_03205 [Phycisphaerales bacterium]|nr:hypothetical protein [Phycisphaerales bacterium]
MNWISFAVLVWLFTGLDVGFRETFQVGHLAIAPSFVPLLAVFLALWAPSVHAAGACLVAGLIMDVTHTVPTESGHAVTVVGAYGLGYLAACAMVLNFRSILLRRNPVTFVALAVVFAAITELVQFTFLRVRSGYDELVLLGVGMDLAQRGGSVVLTGVAAVIVGPVLSFVSPALSLEGGMHGGRRW